MFLPKLFHWKSREDSSFKCVGTSSDDGDDDDDNLDCDCDSLVAYPSLSNLNQDDIDNPETNSHRKNRSSLLLVKQLSGYRECCSAHLIEATRMNYERPSNKEMMERRLELYFKRYPFRGHEDYQVKTAVICKLENCEETKRFDNYIRQNSITPVKCRTGLILLNESNNNDDDDDEKLKHLTGITQQKVEKPIYSTFIDKFSKTDDDRKQFELRSCDSGLSGNISRNPSRVTTRSSQDIYYSAVSSNLSYGEISNDSSSKSRKTIKSKSYTSYSFTTCFNGSSKSYCEEIRKLNLSSGDNSINEEIIDSSKDSLNWTMTTHGNNISLRKQPKDQIENDFDFVTSLSGDNINKLSTDYDLTKISHKSEFLITPPSDMTRITSMENLFHSKNFSNKKMSNETFEKILSVLKCMMSDLSSTESTEWSWSRSNKSTFNSISKLPRKSKKTSSTCVTDLGSLDLCSYLSSFDKSESCWN